MRSKNAIRISPPTLIGVDGNVGLLVADRDATPRAPPNPPPRVRIYAHTSTMAPKCAFGGHVQQQTTGVP